MAVIVEVVESGRHEWRLARILLRGRLLCSGRGVKAGLLILSEKLCGVTMMRVGNDGVVVSVVFECDQLDVLGDV